MGSLNLGVRLGNVTSRGLKAENVLPSNGHVMVSWVSRRNEERGAPHLQKLFFFYFFLFFCSTPSFRSREWWAPDHESSSFQVLPHRSNVFKSPPFFFNTGGRKRQQGGNDDRGRKRQSFSRESTLRMGHRLENEINLFSFVAETRHLAPLVPSHTQSAIESFSGWWDRERGFSRGVRTAFSISIVGRIMVSPPPRRSSRISFMWGGILEDPLQGSYQKELLSQPFLHFSPLV